MLRKRTMIFFIVLTWNLHIFLINYAPIHVAVDNDLNEFVELLLHQPNVEINAQTKDLSLFKCL